jgi:hypothetical protein
VTSLSLYQPGVLDINIENFPTDWNELTRTELKAMSSLLLTPFDKPEQFKALALGQLLRSRSTDLPKDFFQKMNADDVVIAGFPLVEFLIKDNTLITQPFPVLRPKWRAYHGPANAFESLTCGEFEDADIFYHEFQEKPEKEPLARLAAILWRPRKVPYIKFNRFSHKYISYNAEKRLPVFMNLPADVLHTIFIWYAGCRHHLEKIFPNVHEGGTSKDAPDPLAFTKCIHAGAGAKNGSRDQIRCTLMMEYFFEMELEAKKSKELKAEIENAKNQHR